MGMYAVEKVKADSTKETVVSRSEYPSRSIATRNIPRQNTRVVRDRHRRTYKVYVS